MDVEHRMMDVLIKILIIITFQLRKFSISVSECFEWYFVCVRVRLININFRILMRLVVLIQYIRYTSSRVAIQHNSDNSQ